MKFKLGNLVRIKDKEDKKFYGNPVCTITDYDEYDNGHIYYEIKFYGSVDIYQYPFVTGSSEVVKYTYTKRYREDKLEKIKE